MNARVLVVDDDIAMCELIRDGMSPLGFEVAMETSGSKALEQIRTSDFDVVLTDLRMRGMSGLELCNEVQQLRPDVPVVVITAFGNMEAAVEAIRAGAYDFLAKPIELETLEIVLGRAVRHRELTREVRTLRREVRHVNRFSGIIGDSAAMRRLFDLLPRASRSDVPVLLTGETGTGKELVAHALHDASTRAEEPFVAVNCAAIPVNLLESELFGHVRGAFTDAHTSRQGLFVEARGGTIFLDEVGELPLPLQPKLLRVLQEGRVRPVGANREVGIDCRVVAATNRDLKADSDEGRFRSDLYYRIAVIRLSLPPLRTRAGDILLLAQHFLDRAASRMGRNVVSLTTPVARALLAYPWPGNVRELENCIERAVALTEHDRLLLDDLPEEVRNYRAPIDHAGDDDPAHLPPLEDVERRHILRVLDAVEGNKSLAAQILGVDRRTLYRKLERYEDDAGGVS